MASEIKRLEGEDVIVEITTQTLPNGETREVARAFTKVELRQLKARQQDGLDRLDAMLALLN